MTSRRSFLAALASLPFAPKALRALAAPPRPWFTNGVGRASVAEGPYEPIVLGGERERTFWRVQRAWARGEFDGCHTAREVLVPYIDADGELRDWSFAMADIVEGVYRG